MSPGSAARFLDDLRGAEQMRFVHIAQGRHVHVGMLHESLEPVDALPAQADEAHVDPFVGAGDSLRPATAPGEAQGSRAAGRHKKFASVGLHV